MMRAAIRALLVGMTALLLTVDNLRCCMEQIPILRDVPARVPSARARLTALAEVAATLSRKQIGEGALRRKLRDFAEGHSVLMVSTSAARTGTTSMSSSSSG